jgi:glutaredoxin 3
MVIKGELSVMPSVTIYTKGWCPYCSAAKKLLDDKGVDFTEIDIEKKPEARAEMIQKAKGRSTVPQIFIGEKHVGGCDDLYALDDRGQLEPLLQA